MRFLVWTTDTREPGYDEEYAAESHLSIPLDWLVVELLRALFRSHVEPRFGRLIPMAIFG